MVSTIDRMMLREYLEVETENLCDGIGFTCYANGRYVSFNSSINISSEENQLTTKEWLEKLEYVHNAIATSIKRYRELL